MGKIKFANRPWSFILFFILISSANASTVWTNWTDFSIGDPGSAVGKLNLVSLQYSGQVLGTTIVNGTSNIWNPDSTYIGGASNTSPKTVGDVIGLSGSTLTNTINFSSPVTNPLIAIWSLGQPGFSASFNFDKTPVLQVGGPNSIYGGESIKVNGNAVSGMEGNGVVLFKGEYSSISWTSTNENWYGFTVGQQGSEIMTPIPGAVWLFISGLIAIGGFNKRNIKG